MSLFNELDYLVDVPYKQGIDDCYGLARRYYNDVYGIRLRNYARPLAFDHSGLYLIEENFESEGFVRTEVPFNSLEVGDGLLFFVASDHLNHVGTYLGGGYFLHHLYNQKSKIDYLDEAWRRRLGMVVRHPFVSEKNDQTIQSADFFSLVKNNVHI